LSDGDGNPQAFVSGSSASNVWYQRSNTSSWGVISDERIKTNISDLQNGLSIINALRPVSFDYKILDKRSDVGFIAQEYETVLPSQISEQPAIGEDVSALTNNEPVKGINQNLVPYLVKAIQEQQAIITDLKARIETLENK
jgi:hypothetical protein